MENRVPKMGIILDSLTPEEQRELLERIKGLPSRSEISVITSETAVPIKLTWKWIVSLCSLFVMVFSVVIGSVWWLANDRATFARAQVTFAKEQIVLRADLLKLAESLRDSITDTIAQTDANWQLRFQTTMAEVAAARASSDAVVRETLLRLENRLPTQDDYDELKRRIETLEKAALDKSTSAKTAKVSAGCF